MPEGQVEGRTRGRIVGLVLATAAVYFVTAKLGLSLALVAEQVTVVWPPTGIALAAVLLVGPKVWPGIALGAFAANVTTEASVLAATGIAVGNTLEAKLGAFLLWRLRFRIAFKRLRDVIYFLLAGAMGSTLASATIGVGSLCATGIEPWPRYWSLWWVWWIGDAIGGLVVAPLLLVWSAVVTAPDRRRVLEALTLSAATAFISLVVFAGRPAIGVLGYPLHYIIFPLVVAAALRARQLGTTAVTCVAAGIAIWSTAHGLGPFSLSTTHESLIMVQLFMGVVAATGLVLGAALAERDTARARQAKDLAALAVSEEALRERARQLADADRRKDEFLAMLGHELRNPLSAVRNAVATASLDPSRSPRALEIARRQTDQLSRLIDDLLDVARITQGRITLQTEPIELVPIIERAIDGMRSTINARGLHLTLALEGGAIVVDGDATRLEQVFVNLLSNAAKYTDRGGQVAVTCRRQDDAAIVSIRDTGIGIAPDMLPRIWDLFVQGERTLDRAQGGLGIGLTLARRLIELHRGRCTARSEGIGMGTELVVCLPLAPAPPRSRTVEPAAPAPGQPAHILVVEDNPDAGESLVTFLELHGHRVRLVYDGTAALEAALADVPDVMLLDIGLPDIDGYEIARRVRRDPTLQHTVLVALTGYGLDEDKEQARSAGFDHHLVKPVSPSALRALVARIASNHPKGPRAPAI